MKNVGISKMKKIIKKIKAKIRGTIDLERLIKDGLSVGDNFHAQEGVIIDPWHCWLIEIGNNVTLAPRVHILAHDASTKNILGYTKISNVKIGNNVFVGAGTIILPGVTIEDNVIIGAGSVVTKDCKEGVYAGNPCTLVCSYQEYVNKQSKRLDMLPRYNEDFIIGNITEEKKKMMKQEIFANKGGFIV